MTFDDKELRDLFLNCSLDRTLFQFSKFVVNKHDTPGRRWLQAVTELKNCYFELKRLRIDYDEAKAQSRAWNIFKRRRARLRMEQLFYDLDTREKEFFKLGEIIKRMNPYTWEKIEREEKEYYLLRLKRQALEEQASDASKISVGTLQSMEQAGLITINQWALIGPDGKPNGQVGIAINEVETGPKQIKTL